MLVERDATSSGVQIAAALTRNAEMAKSVNLIRSDSKQDVYQIVADRTNAEFAALGLDWTLDRNDVKKATIATIYGGTHRTAYKELALAVGVGYSSNPDAFRAFWGVLKDVMAGVIQVERYFRIILRHIEERGYEVMELPLPTGGTAVFRAKYPLKNIDGSVRIRKSRSKEQLRAQLREAPESKKDSIAKSSYAASYRLAMPYRPKRFAPKSVTASYIQGYDAAILATVQLRLAEQGVYPLCKHDAFLLDQSHEDLLIRTFREAMYDLFKGHPLDDLRDRLQERYDIELPTFDEIYGYGDFDPNELLKATHLVAE